jgi:molecular chaperone DnaK (HSP70)
MISVTDEGRLFGADSLMAMSKFPYSTYGDFIRILGQKYEQEFINDLKKHYFIMNEFAEDERGLIGYKIQRKDANGTIEE